MKGNDLLESPKNWGCHPDNLYIWWINNAVEADFCGKYAFVVHVGHK
jgi:hypothetical protein